MSGEKYKYCPNCGHRVSEENNFCPLCGYALKTQRKNGRSIVVILLAIIAVVLIICVLLFSCSKNSDNAPVDSVETEKTEKTEEISQTYSVSEKTEDISKEEEALEAARIYSDKYHMSKQGIYNKLTNEENGFTEEEAQYAVDNVNADFKENAYKTAEEYAENTEMPIEEIYLKLIDTENAFTEEEAMYAAEEMGGVYNNYSEKLCEVVLEEEFVNFYDFNEKTFDELTMMHPELEEARSCIEVIDEDKQCSGLGLNSIISGRDGYLYLVFCGEEMICKAALFDSQLNNPTALYKTVMVSDFREPMIQRFGEPNSGDTVINGQDVYESLIKNTDYEDAWIGENDGMLISYSADEDMLSANMVNFDIDNEGLADIVREKHSAAMARNALFNSSGEKINLEVMNVCDMKGLTVEELSIKYLNGTDIEDSLMPTEENGKELFGVPIYVTVDGVDGKLVLFFEGEEKICKYAIFFSSFSDASPLYKVKSFQTYRNSLMEKYGSPEGGESIVDGINYDVSIIEDGCAEEGWISDEMQIILSTKADKPENLFALLCGDFTNSEDVELITSNLLDKWFRY